ncbi:unnamed protein product [Rhodiola kirilowii]
MEMVMEIVLTVLATVLLSFLVAKLVSAGVGGGEGREVVERVVVEERRLEGGSGGRRSGKKVRFVGVEERLVANRFEGVEADDRVVIEGRCESEITVVDEGFTRFECGVDERALKVELAAVGEDCRQIEEISANDNKGEQMGEVSALRELSEEKSLQFNCQADVVERDEVPVYESGVEIIGNNAVSGDSVEELKDEQVVGADENVNERVEDLIGSGLDETRDESEATTVGSCQPMITSRLEKIGGVAEGQDRGKNSLLVDEIGVGFSHSNEVVSHAQDEHNDELFEDKEIIELQVMDVENVYDGEEEISKELKDALAERIEEHIRSVEDEAIAEGDNSDEGYKNELEETAEPKNIQFELKDEVEDEAIAEGYNADEGYKNELEETAEPKNIQFELKDELAGELFGSSGEDDWEGIEMSKLDNDFTVAAAFVRKEDKDGKLSSISSEVKMLLYGLQKIVMEGPCREPQPMALKISARAKWNAWQRLGNMNPEDAMKQYITLVSDIKPEWGEQNAWADDQSDDLESKKDSASDPNHSKPPPNESEGNKELIHITKCIDTGSSSLEFKD